MLVIAGLLVVASTAFASQATAARRRSRSECPHRADHSEHQKRLSGLGRLLWIRIVVPFGHATETILFGGDCGGRGFRTVNIAGGTLYLDEFFSDGSCPGS
jgi:hypothetical protein